MKKTNLAKKGLMPAVLGAVCSVVALTSVSYAWFTMGNSAQVDDINVKVDAADGMQISVDALNWKSTINSTELAAKDGNQMLVSKGENDALVYDSVMPVSTDGIVKEGGVLNFYEGKLASDGSTVLAKADTGNFVRFDLYIQLDSAKKLQLDAGSTVEGLNGSEIDLATRVAFIDLGSVSPETENLNAAALALNGSTVLESEVKQYVWEPNAYNHTEAARYQDSTLRDDMVVGYKGINGLTGDDVEGYKKATVTDAFVATNPTEARIEGTSVGILDLEKGINKIRVYIWVEGQDVDCLNDVSGSQFVTNLKFSIPDKNSKK